MPRTRQRKGNEDVKRVATMVSRNCLKGLANHVNGYSANRQENDDTAEVMATAYHAATSLTGRGRVADWVSARHEVVREPFSNTTIEPA